MIMDGRFVLVKLQWGRKKTQLGWNWGRKTSGGEELGKSGMNLQ
jgi:hypothetical protein